MAHSPLYSPLQGLTINTNVGGCDSFPAYIDPFDSSDDTVAESDISTMASSSPSPITAPSIKKLSEKLREDPSRHASPQPTSVSHGLHPINGGNGYRVLRSATVGYFAPPYAGKADQMKEGEQ